MIYNCNSSWTRCHILCNHLWYTLPITKTSKLSFFIGHHKLWLVWTHFSFSFSSKLTIIASHSAFTSLNHIVVEYVFTILFFPWCHGGKLKNNRKNDWFGHKSQTHGLLSIVFSSELSSNFYFLRTMATNIKGKMEFSFKIA